MNKWQEIKYIEKKIQSLEARKARLKILAEGPPISEGPQVSLPVLRNPVSTEKRKERPCRTPEEMSFFIGMHVRSLNGFSPMKVVGVSEVGFYLAEIGTQCVDHDWDDHIPANEMFENWRAVESYESEDGTFCHIIGEYCPTKFRVLYVLGKGLSLRSEIVMADSSWEAGKRFISKNPGARIIQIESAMRTWTPKELESLTDTTLEVDYDPLV